MVNIMDVLGVGPCGSYFEDESCFGASILDWDATAVECPRKPAAPESTRSLAASNVEIDRVAVLELVQAAIGDNA